MPRVDRSVTKHRLSLKPNHRPVQQKKRNFRGEKQHAIWEKVERLLVAEYMKEIKYSP
ncbi:hypothetical protein AXF42_Ash015928 [Apostasia shenzhenica]|uniref:Uncharacterized protein n=1 Tax=Apostasia shenzhenica TaxID=1088818 RepID=A0A2I0AWF9_9ASPA|nr:hypothetical protein AXF42_Ash015928 [Apostasia shenzhenica]